ncbi:MAG: hypothetical protein D6785_05505 [Planctomycetota bacterium]|nr:MAG: hypothetical protein D6785_05505 [Planctomycetota bacterium]
MYVILDGEVKIPIFDALGRQKLVARLGKGDFFGEMALLTGDPRAADVIAVNPLRVAKINKQVYLALIRKYPSIARFLTEILAKRLSESDIMLSKTVGKYRLLDEIGRGGMSIVYSAYHPGLQRTVAVKMLDHQLVFDEEFATRFKNEGKIIASLKHPNIVEVYDMEQAYATYFIIMEYLEGTTLERIIDTHGKLDPEFARAVLIQTASALAYAHDKGIIHRDIKPSNIMVDKNNQVKLMDFGISRKDKDDPIDESDEIIGTAPYMAPEQIQQMPIDGRCDLYALGVTAYEMLTGRLPFDAADSLEILQMHLVKRPTHPKDINPNIPDDLAEFVMKSLEKKPDQRFPNLKEAQKFLARHHDQPKFVGKVITLSYAREDIKKVEAFVQELKSLGKKYPEIEFGFGEIQSKI